MNFKDIFKSTIKSVKKASIGLWILCLIGAIFTMGNLYIEDTVGLHIETSYDYLSDEYLIEDDLDLEAILNEEYLLNEEYMFDEEHMLNFYDAVLEQELEDLTSSFMDNNAGFFVMIVLIAIIVFVIVLLISFILNIIYGYFINLFALETVEGKTFDKKKSLWQTSLALFLFALMVMGLALIITVLVVAGDIVKMPLLVFLAVPVMVYMVYICIRYGAIYYVGIKYQDLSAKEILKKAKSITKGNVLKIFGYTLLFEIILFIAALPLFIITTVLSFDTFIYLTIGFVLDVAITTMVNMLTILFTVTLFKSLDEEKSDFKEELDIEKESN